jgi:membrane-associated phospholipid phosphatase
MLKDFLRSPFFTNYIAFLMLGLFLVVYLPKGAFFLMINGHHAAASDLFFRYATFLGDGVLFAILIAGLLFYKYYYAIVAAITGILQAVALYVFKHWLFAGYPRPKAFFSGEVDVYIIDGVDVHSFNSFPSGHTATAFALFALLTLVVNSRSQYVGVLFFVLACIGGYSRIHLSQHFLIDVYFGSLVGVASAMAGIVVSEKVFAKKRERLMNRSLISSS